MRHRSLGGSALSIAPLALGAHVFGWTVDERTSRSILDAFCDHGLSLIDTADTYSIWVPGHRGGESESIIGNWLKDSGRREQVLIATKVGGNMPGLGGGLTSEHIIRSCEASLRRLATDRIDLYQAHFDDHSVPLEETLAAFQLLLKTGKVRAIGASNYTAERLRAALGIAREHGLPLFTTLQPHYNLVHRGFYEGSLARLCADENLGVIPYRPLEAGLLTGKYRCLEDTLDRPRGAVVARSLDPRSLDILGELDRAAVRNGATPGQIAIAWLLAQPGITAPIVSVTNVAQLVELASALDIQLDARTLMRLDMVSA